MIRIAPLWLIAARFRLPPSGGTESARQAPSKTVPSKTVPSKTVPSKTVAVPVGGALVAGAANRPEIRGLVG